jgi:hypothetical protein
MVGEGVKFLVYGERSCIRQDQEGCRKIDSRVFSSFDVRWRVRAERNPRTLKRKHPTKLQFIL